MAIADNGLSKSQLNLLIIALINLLLLSLFPPYDDYAISQFGVGVFHGFLFIGSSKSPHLKINNGFFTLEFIVVFVNFGLLWLLSLRQKRKGTAKTEYLRIGGLLVVVLNLIVVLLFPPFEYISHITQAVIPSFEGFYFVFAHPPNRAIVTPLLYLEVILVSINACLLLLFIKGKSSNQSIQEDVLRKLIGYKKQR